jgi:hypothetical protein
MRHDNRRDAPYLLDIPNCQVMPILEKIGTRLEPGQNWAHAVWVETDGRQTIAYADMASRIEDPYQVAETDVVFFVPFRALIPFASMQLLSYLIDVDSMPAHEAKLAKSTLMYQRYAWNRAQKLKKLISDEFAL